MPQETIPRPAYVVDVDESSGKQVRGTVRSALKEKPKVSQRESRPTRTKKPHSDSGEGSSSYAQAFEVVTEKEMKMERRKSISGSVKSPRKATRPPLAHENRSSKTSAPQRSPRENPSHYGVPSSASYGPPAVAPHVPIQIPLRPRAITTQTLPTRPLSYHQPYTSSGAHGPPLSMSAYYQHAITPSYPPPSPSYMQYAATPQPTTPQVDYFAQQISQPPPRALKDRFEAIPRSHHQVIDPITRTTSAFGVRDTRRQSMDGHYEEGYYEDSYASRISDPQVRRRETIRAPVVRLKEDPDTIAMPPPPRPGILRRPATEYPAEVRETRAEYEERRDREERQERQKRQEREDRQERKDRQERQERQERLDRLERQERSQHREQARPRRPSANRNSVSYDLGKDSDRVRLETANNGRRRQSYYGQSTSMGSGGSGYEDKYAQAANYQEDVGGPTIPLTAETLKKQQRRQGGSTRSTKSSGSRDESDYRKSATTRTTRSGSGNDDENVTIKVVGQARVMVGGAQIDCNDGGEISISRQKSLRNGSERGSEFGGQRQIDDRRSRVDRPIGRSRISSTHSYTRSTPQYQMDNYL